MTDGVSRTDWKWGRTTTLVYQEFVSMTLSASWALLFAALPLGTSGGTAPAEKTGAIPASPPAASAPLYHWQDFDRDGALDVYVQASDHDRLLHNTGGRFVDVTTQFGLASQAGTQWIAWLDFDGDQLPDLSLIDAAGKLRVLRNAATDFEDITDASGLPVEAVAFAEWNDLDADGLVDAHVVTSTEDRFFKNLGHGQFSLGGPLSTAAGFR